MSGYRKLGRTSSQRKALLRNQVTNLLYYGRITTTDTKAKEIRKIAERLITLAVKEKDNYETVTVTQKVPKKTADGRRVKDKPSRLNARRQMLKTFYPIVETPANGLKLRTESKKVDMPAKMFAEIAPKYENRKGGYTRIVKVGPRKGDGAEMVIIELV